MAPVRPLIISGISIFPPLALAPMAGVTNALFRKLFKPFGLGLTVSEFVSAQSLVRMHKRTLEMIDVYSDERPTAVQLHGNDPDVMAQAAAFVDGVDVRVHGRHKAHFVFVSVRRFFEIVRTGSPPHLACG